MGSLIFHEFKRQASIFFKEKFKTARLALTDVTPAELLADETTKGNMLSPDANSLGVISRAAFEVDDYWRIVDIIHKRLSEFDGKTWRTSYNAMVLLEHLLTHGPLRVFDEFQSDKGAIQDMGNFQYVDEKGFNWGLRITKLSERILMLLENKLFLKGERERARKLTLGIKGFGSFNQRSSAVEERFDSSEWYGRCNSNYNVRQNQVNDLPEENGSLLDGEEIGNGQQNYRNENPAKERKIEGEHPFCEDEEEDAESLLSAVGK
ncbi:hypothetical protein SLEP1_g5738 [Rubroshorea leprosula]|uniref:ENTH domain-containing protein n=1 Tax=Rubroshorea leprosula TaxID=152421 RepID=A0AAV5I1R3_9ROSI|nr:hypothetical protein SLEP1_g5738 [Rubroshorea leprosula]